MGEFRRSCMIGVFPTNWKHHHYWTVSLFFLSLFLFVFWFSLSLPLQFCSSLILLGFSNALFMVCGLFYFAWFSNFQVVCYFFEFIFFLTSTVAPLTLYIIWFVVWCSDELFNLFFNSLTFPILPCRYIFSLLQWTNVTVLLVITPNPIGLYLFMFSLTLPFLPQLMPICLELSVFFSQLVFPTFVQPN